MNDGVFYVEIKPEKEKAVKRSLCIKMAIGISISAVMSLGLLVSKAEAKPEFMTKEKVPCATCHVTVTPPVKLSDVGECYKRHGFKDLAACKKDPKK